MALVSVSKHEKALRQMRCVVSNSPEVTLHHCHGGSMIDNGWAVGMGQRQNPFLQIPLGAMYHIGGWGIDAGIGVDSWEATWGTQWSLLEKVNKQLPYDIFEQANQWEDKHRSKSRRNTSAGR